MRTLYRLIGYTSLVAALSGFAPVMALAASTGNVLVPSGNSQPNLGLSPRVTAPAGNTPDTKDGDKNSTDTKADAIIPTPAAASPSMPTMDEPSLPALTNGQFTPIPTTATTPATGKPSDPLHFATTIVNEPAANMAWPDDKSFKRPAHVLGIDLSPKSLWGPNDLTAINNKLGIDKKDIPSLCRLSLNGTLVGGQSLVSFDTMGGAHIDALYDGALSNLRIGTRAACPLVSLTSHLGYVIQNGDKYIVPLGAVTCPALPANQPPKSVMVVYKGNNAAECTFQ